MDFLTTSLVIGNVAGVCALMWAAKAARSRNRLEHAVRDKEDRLAIALRASDQGLYETNLRTWKVSLSAEYMQMLGYEPVSTVVDFATVREWRHPQDDVDMQRVYDEYVAGTRSEHRHELRQRSARGDWIWVLTTGRVFDRDHAGHAVRVVGTNANVTVRKQAELALASEHAFFRTIVDAIPDPILTKDKSGRLTTCNTAAARHLGFRNAADVRGKSVQELYQPQFAELYLADDARVLLGESIYDREEPGVDARGGQRWYLTTKVPLRDASGGIVGMVRISRDITDAKQADEMLRRAQKLDSLGTLAGGIAHDFNNLLAIMIGNLRLAREQIPATSPAQQPLAEVSGASKRAADLVKQILSFSRPQETSRKLIALQPVIEDALKLMRSTLPAMIRIEAEFKPNVSSILGDAGQIHQAVVNLVTNAAHAIGEKAGCVRLSLDMLVLDPRQAKMRLSSILSEGNYVCLSVADDGSGMDEATRQRVFDPFFTTKPGGEGTGLGLSIVHAVVRGHKGAVTVHSEPGKGSTFRLYFPAGEEESLDSGATSSLAGHGTARRGHILYIDDEARLVQLGKVALERYGHRVDGFTDPERALETFKSDPKDFDAVVTDFSMPVLSGVDVAREIRALRPDLPVILVTGVLQPEASAAIRAAGLNQILTKPDHLEQLGPAVLGVLSDR